MAEKCINVESALRAAFLKNELEYLESHPHFLAAAKKTKTSSDFVELCELAEQLLKQQDRANPVAKQFRSALNHDPKSGPSATE